MVPPTFIYWFFLIFYIFGIGFEEFLSAHKAIHIIFLYKSQQEVLQVNILLNLWFQADIISAMFLTNDWLLHSSSNINWLFATNQVLFHGEQNNEQMSQVTVSQNMLPSSQCKDMDHTQNQVTMPMRGEEHRENQGRQKWWFLSGLYRMGLLMREVYKEP